MEWMMHDDRLVALGTGRNHRDRNAGQRFDSSQVAARRTRERREALDAECALPPSGQLFVDRLALSNRLGARRQERERVTADMIAGADADRWQSVEDVELRDAQAIDSVQLQRAR